MLYFLQIIGNIFSFETIKLSSSSSKYNRLILVPIKISFKKSLKLLLNTL